MLHTSQSSLSKHIAALENQLKADVFIRQGKRLVGLSPIGEQLLPHIEKIFVEIRTIENLTLDFQNPDTGELAIATTHTQARYVLPWVVKRFRERYPNVRLILSQADPESIAHMVAQGQADIGIATESLLTKDNLQCTRYYDWYHHIIVPEGHALAAQDSVDIATLAQYPADCTYQRWDLPRRRGMIWLAACGQCTASMCQYWLCAKASIAHARKAA
ncbi:HTH-type transcriptional regulator cbl [Moraxella atlantae]|uniref:HTH-type transcriptional regulator cbl n=1 Tax=Faucicola atlantae TaxID=34059 RepID=A0A378QLK8_9GAMM|nr:HTH-type transcriptional regulator cbl [Moraxella atlantae]